MAKLSINTWTALGPLTVEVRNPRGERVGAPLLMSSLRQHAIIERVAPGDYLIIATRPSGEQLISTATVGRNGGQAMIRMAGESPREFLTEAAEFGLAYAPEPVPRVNDDGTVAIPRNDFLATAIGSPRAANTAARSMSVLVGKADVPAELRLSLTDEEDMPGGLATSLHRLVAWSYHDGRWRRRDAPPARPDTDYLQVQLADMAPTALGLLNSGGFGPIVIVPAFSGGVTVTFLAAGLAMEDSADRVGNPSAVRVPVAIATPNNPGIADLLVGINASVLPYAGQLFDEGRDADAEMALERLARKYQDPAAAALGALFLARFAPERLPLSWLLNLNGILPDVADTWLLLAWARSIQGDGDMAWQQSITEQLRRAQACRCTLFSRTRYQLSQLGWRYGPHPRARQEEVATPRRARTGDYLDFAAEASGLEAYWGYSPTRPGLGSEPPARPPEGRAVTLRGGKFMATG
jgi:hypothetical protein